MRSLRGRLFAATLAALALTLTLTIAIGAILTTPRSPLLRIRQTPSPPSGGSP